MNISDKKIQAILALPASKRYSHFIKVAADQRKIWGLYADGWAIFGTDDGKRAFPVWPSKEYAQLCAVSEWSIFCPREIDLDTVFQILLPKLRDAGEQIAVFPTPGQKGILPELDMMENDLREELSKIE